MKIYKYSVNLLLVIIISAFLTTSNCLSENTIFISKLNMTLAELANNLNNLTNAEKIKLGDKYLKFAKFNSTFAFNMAEAYFKFNQLDKAINILNQVPDESFNKYRLLGSCFLMKFKLDKATEYFKKAEEFINPKKHPEFFAITKAGFADIELIKGNFKKAEHYIKLALNFDAEGKFSYPLYAQIRLEFLRKNYNKCEKLIKSAIDKYEQEAFPYAYLADICIFKREYEKAAELLKKVNQLSKIHGQLWCDGPSQIMSYQLATKKTTFTPLILPFEIQATNFIYTILKLQKEVFNFNFKNINRYSRQYFYLIENTLKRKLEFNKDLLTFSSPFFTILTAGLYTLKKEIIPSELIDFLHNSLVIQMKKSKSNKSLFPILLNMIEIQKLYSAKKYKELLKLIRNMEKTLDEKKLKKDINNFIYTDLYDSLSRLLEKHILDITLLNEKLLKDKINDSLDKKEKIEKFLKKIYTDKEINKALLFYKLFLLLTRGDILFETGKPLKAIQSYKKALALSKNFFINLKTELDKRTETLNPQNIFYPPDRPISDLFCELALFYLKVGSSSEALSIILKGNSIFKNNKRLLQYKKQIKEILDQLKK